MSIVGLITVFLATSLTNYVFIRLAPAMKLLAMPGAHRRHHSPTPLVGGIAIYVGILVGFVVIDSSFHGFLPCLFLMCLVGVLDDRFTLPSWSRFLAQGLAAFLMTKLTGVQLESLGFLFSDQSEILLGSWSTPITIFATIGVINAVNMSDGMDGLGGGLVLLILVSLVILGSPSMGLVLITIVSVLGFLIWNVRLLGKQARAFMGDAGSTMLGLLLAYLLIEVTQGGQGVAPVTALWLMALPLMDAVAVLIARPLNGKSPFSADRSHYHHLLLQRGMSVNLALIAVLSSQALFIAAGLTMWTLQVAQHWQIKGFLALFAIYLVFLIVSTKAKT